MSAEAVGTLCIAALVGLLLAGCPVALAMMLVGTAGFAAIVGPGPALSILEKSAFDVASNHALTLVPLFLLMGAIAARAGLSRDLFAAARRLSGGRPGGLAVAGIAASGAFSAVSGSSLATASAMTRVAWPEMRRHGTDSRLASGALAAGGTLGIMIPPSIALLLYALITEQSVGAMFAAGLVPGLVAFSLYALTAALVARVWTDRGADSPTGAGDTGRTADASCPTASPRDGEGTLLGAAPVLGLFTLVMGGLYGGVFTPTEAGGAGAGLALVIAVARGTGWRALTAALVETVAVSAGVFLILIGAEVFGYLLSVSRIAPALAAAVEAAGWGPLALLAAILAFYLVLGCVMESLAMILLTVPIFFPLVEAAGIDPIWFGVLCVVAVETGLITPPMGLNLFVVRAAAPGLELRTVMVGALPFVAADVVRLTLLVALPGLSLWLPRALGY